MPKVLLSGGTGMLGLETLSLLRAAGSHGVRCLVRPTSRVERLGEVELAQGDAADEDSLERALQGVDAFIHVAGIQYSPQMIPAMKRAGVSRLVIVSSTSAHSSFEHRSGPRRSMETLVRESGLDWTIVRPSMIYGSELDHNIHHLLRFLDRWPVFPVFGSGENLWQPVYYKDLAAGVLAAFERPVAIGKSYDLPGAHPLSYLQLVKTAAGTLGKTPRIVRLPLEPVRRVLQTAELVRLPLPVKSEQVLRLREDKAYPYEDSRRDLDYEPRSFGDGIVLEVARLREIGMVGV